MSDLDRDDRWLIVGLGNPGSKYTLNWHNVGYMCIQMLEEIHGIRVNKIKFKGLYGSGEIEGAKVILLKPTTFMNLSGESIKEAAAFYKIPADRIIVIYDDVDINIGKMRIRMQGGPGTHNGMKSIIPHLGTEKFIRIRIGIGPVPDEWDLADYVLSDVQPDYRESLYESLQASCVAVRDIIDKGIQNAMNIHNPVHSSRRAHKNGEDANERTEGGDTQTGSEGMTKGGDMLDGSEEMIAGNNTQDNGED